MGLRFFLPCIGKSDYHNISDQIAKFRSGIRKFLNVYRKNLLMMPILLPVAHASERSRLLAVSVIRRRALERLYERRKAVESLIQSLEDYQRVREARVASPVYLNASRKCS
jgi:hypothetical protein